MFVPESLWLSMASCGSFKSPRTRTVSTLIGGARLANLLRIGAQAITPQAARPLPRSAERFFEIVEIADCRRMEKPAPSRRISSTRALDVPLQKYQV
jgi:hypothetical protein